MIPFIKQSCSNPIRNLLVALAVLGGAVACAIEGPAEDSYAINTPLGGGSVTIKRPGGPMFATIKCDSGGCLWFTSTTDPLNCIGECIQVPPGGGAYQIPSGPNVWHFSDDCDDCPCKPKEVKPECEGAMPGGAYAHAQHAFAFGRFITSVEDVEGWSATVLAGNSVQAQRAYERLRDRQEAEHIADSYQYVELLNLNRQGRTDWRVWVRDDNEKIENVKVTLQGEEIGKTTYQSGTWGNGSETVINLSGRNFVGNLIGARVELRVTWTQSGVARETTWKATLQ